jgi:hypothetical protein
MRKGFWQIRLTERAKQICTITTPFGLYQFNVMCFGLKNAPASFQRLMNIILDGLESFVVCFIDDICIYTSDDWSTHLQHNQIVLERLRQAGLTVNFDKSDFCSAQIEYLGYIVGSGKVLPKESNVRDILGFPVPRSRKMIKQFLGGIGYYRQFICNFSHVTEPLTNLLKKKSEFVWCQKCDSAFINLKKTLANPPVLLAPDFSKPFQLAVDCSDVGMGAVLLQTDENGIERPVSYFSKKLLSHQKPYSTVEKECLALICALSHYYLYLSIGAVTIYTDHNPLVYINKQKGLNARLLRWSLCKF